MQSHGLRWTRLCVASTATALFTSAAALSASAGEKHALQPGESLDSLARKYHVSEPDLIRVNHIEDENKIPDGRVLTIPPPLRHLAVHPTMHTAAHINKDSVSVRLGPGLEYRKVSFGYEGDAVTVTAEQDGWAQVTLEDGKTGWVLQSLLRHGRHGGGEQTASRKGDADSDTPRPSRKPSHHAVMVALDEDRSRARKVARHQLSASASAHKHHAQHQEPKDREEGKGKRAERVAARKSARRHHAELVAKLEHHSASRRVHHHADDSEVAVSSHKRRVRHHDEESEVKVARKHSHHAEKATQIARADSTVAIPHGIKPASTRQANSASPAPPTTAAPATATTKTAGVWQQFAVTLPRTAGTRPTPVMTWCEPRTPIGVHRTCGAASVRAASTAPGSPCTCTAKRAFRCRTRRGRSSAWGVT